jgi:hypothetical protein
MRGTDRKSRHPHFNHVHIDCDPMVYKYGFATQENVFKVDSEQFKTKALAEAACAERKLDPTCIVKKVIAGPLGDAQFLVDRKIRKIQNLFGAGKTHLYLSPRENFRNCLWDEYKANRSGNEKPVHYKGIRDFLVYNNKAKLVDGIEADDAVSINHFYIFKRGKSPRSANRDTVIVAVDKDFNNVPGFHYNPDKDELIYISIADAIRHFYLQMLTGDTVDNVAGIPGVGPKKAVNILPAGYSDKNLWGAVREAYLAYAEAKNLDKEQVLDQMMINAHMLYILWEKDKFFVPPLEVDKCRNLKLLEKIKEYQTRKG